MAVFLFDGAAAGWGSRQEAGAMAFGDGRALPVEAATDGFVLIASLQTAPE